MIDIFIPTKIGSFYLVPQRILGFDVSKTHVYCTQLYVSSKDTTIERIFQEQLDLDTNKSYTQRVSATIDKIIQNADPYHTLKTSLSSALVIFKELQFPFVDVEKIALIVKYEVEPFLPFSLADSIVDFIITHVDKELGSTNVLVAAVQKKYIAEHLSYFEAAGLSPNKISVDLFDLYGLYTTIPSYAQSQQSTVLVDIEFNVTRIAFIVKGQLKLVRTLPKGILSIAKMIAQDQAAQSSQALEDIIRFGFEKYNDAHYRQAAESAWGKLFDEIKFTLHSFTQQTGGQETIGRIILLGRGAEINGIDRFANKTLDITCQFFDTNALLKIPTVKIKNTASVPRSAIMSLSTAFENTVTENFNLRQEEFALSTSFNFYKKFFTLIALIASLFALLIGNTVWQKRRLTNTARTLQQAVVNSLRERDLAEAKDFNGAINQAYDKVNSEEELWFAFSRQQRFSFLKILQDLSTAIDRESIGLNLKKLVITSNDVTLEGSVKGFEELKVLERELRESKLFSIVPTLQELKFSQKLPLKKNGNQSS